MQVPVAEVLLDRMAGIMRQRLPPGVSPSYFDGFMRRNRPALVRVLDAQLQRRRPHAGLSRPDSRALAELPELWTPGQRTRANLDAMRLLVGREGETFTAAEREVLARYSGWGGLSLEKVASELDALSLQGLPVPEQRGLIHEYYTPTVVTRAVAEVLRPLIPELAGNGDRVQALEPSAGIGRFIHALSGPGFERLQWHAVEWSALSHRILRALRPDIDLLHGPFERWVRLEGPRMAGRVQLLVANPPYGPRGAALTEDPDRSYREKRAYLYFLRRGLDLLAPNGLGVFLVPYGWLSGKSREMQTAREAVLKRHHLAAAYRLPSVTPGGKASLFPGAMLVTDLLFFRARGGELPEVDAGDQFILDGDYFQSFPRHVLGRELGQGGDDDDQTAKPRWGYQVEGTFTGLPELVERPMCSSCAVTPHAPPDATAKARSGLARSLATDTAGLSHELAAAVTLGERVDRFLAAVAKESQEALLLWGELHEALRAWTRAHGNPHRNAGLKRLVHKGRAAAERFLNAFTPAGELIPGIAKRPTWTPGARLQPDDILGQAETLYRHARALTRTVLLRWHRERFKGSLDEAEATQRLIAGGWCLDGDALLPADDYLSGHLWERYDRAQRLVRQGGPWAPVYTEQLAKLRAAIQPVVFEDITGLSPRHGWIPLDLVGQWMSEALQASWFDDVVLVKRDGLVQLAGVEYEKSTSTKVRGRMVAEQVIWAIGWMNHDKTLFKPKVKRKEGENLDAKRFAMAKQWEGSFAAWVAKDEDRRLRVEAAYNRQFRGFVPPAYGTEPLRVARWSGDIRLHPYQVSAVRRLLSNRRGLLAFDVGLGKTYSGLAALAAARQEGWAKRPVILVPNSIVWKWHRDVKRVLPDYRVVVIGSNRRQVERSPDQVERVGSLDQALAQVSGRASKQREVLRAMGAGLSVDAAVERWGSSVKAILKSLVEAGAARFTWGEAGRWRTQSETDTPEQRGQKWSRFQAGEYDVALLTYTALGRTRMNEDALREYAASVEAIQREVRLAQRNARATKKRTERQAALDAEGVAAWVAEKIELPSGWEYDHGVAWDDLGVDFLMVDEAQNFKNLYMPESREGGVPRFMGNPGDGSDRAWQLDFRAASVRKRSGGAGVVLLSATPAKNSPLEFYNLLQLVDPGLWTATGIDNPEAFISRYMAVELRTVLNTAMQPVDRGAVVGFTNLHELRDLLFRYAEFRTADEVGLELPEPKVERVEVDMNRRQEALYEQYTQQIEDALNSDDPRDKSAILGLLARMSIVAIHDRLEGMDWKKAKRAKGIPATSPKFAACARRVLANRHCGHIIFVDNTAAHWWMRQVLIDEGIPAERIAVLNAEVAKTPADRQAIAEAFNGNPDEDLAPAYDVVIANAVAYEGVDLQTRTCAIHHLDLPWEPATLQQRNGRGVRQGNTLDTIAIYYYFARRSMDGLRFNLIQGKRGWLTQLIVSQDRDTNNPGAQQDLGAEDVLLLISRDPDKTKKLLAAKKEKAELKRRMELSEAAGNVLRGVNTRFRKAERTDDPAEAARLREEAEAKLGELARWDRDAWPWAELMYVVREQEVFVVPGGEKSQEHRNMPLTRGLRLTAADEFRDDVQRHLEVGDIWSDDKGELRLALREAGQATWRQLTLEGFATLKGITPEGVRAGWPADADEELDAARQLRALNRPTTDVWGRLDWVRASEAFKRLTWERHAELLREALGQRRSSYLTYHLPVVQDGRLRVVDGPSLRSSHELLPYTEAGWQRFLALAPDSGLKFTALDEAASWWWGQKLPRSLLADARRKDAA
ncbi:MAG: DEAD/DEAH box helicase family protein [Alphaproteobacteria bacterium]|nr:DEAD/DEAH box helicase family protein [Alphaproteobacteria bacterium]